MYFDVLYRGAPEEVSDQCFTWIYAPYAVTRQAPGEPTSNVKQNSGFGARCTPRLKLARCLLLW